jgi:hypothetical protein
VIRLFKNSHPIAIMLLVIIAAFPYYSITTSGLHTTLLIDNKLYLLNFLQITGGFFEKPIVLNLLASTAIVVIESLFFNKIINDQKIFDRPGFLPALSYVLMSSLVPLHYQSYMLIINGMLLLSISNILSVYKKEKVNNSILIAYFFTGAITCFSISYLPLCIWLFISLIIMRPTSLREIMLAFTGLVLPFYFLVSILYLSSNFSQITIFQQIKFSITFPQLDILSWVKIVFFLLMPLLGILRSNSLVSKMLIQGRKTYTVMFVLFICAVVINFLSLVNFPFTLYLLVIPSGFLITPLFLSSKKYFWPNLLLMLLIFLCFLG